MTFILSSFFSKFGVNRYAVRRASNMVIPRVSKMLSNQPKSFSAWASKSKPMTLMTLHMKPQRIFKINYRSYCAAKPMNEKIAQQVKAAPLVVYMKGTPDNPQCGFSRAVCEVFKREGVTSYDYYNVLIDSDLRQGIKDYSKWPTIPQVFIGGEFVGGCDIIMDMHSEGSLFDALKAAGTPMKDI